MRHLEIFTIVSFLHNNNLLTNWNFCGSVYRNNVFFGNCFFVVAVVKQQSELKFLGDIKRSVVCCIVITN